MIMIQAAGTTSINPFFPLLTRAHRPVRTVPWSHYRKTLIPFTIISFCLFSYGIAMTRTELYSDGRFEIFSFANLCFAFVRTMRFRKTSSIYVEPDLALQKISLLADLDFALCFGSFGIGCQVVAIQNSADSGGLFCLLGVGCIFFALIPAFNSLTLFLRRRLRSLAS
jgi:hypothetical protein